MYVCILDFVVYRNDFMMLIPLHVLLWFYVVWTLVRNFSCKASRMFNLGFILCELWYKCIYFGSHILDLFVHFQMVQIELQYAVTSSWQVGKNAWDEYTLPSQFSYILNCWNILRTNICPYIVHVTSFHCLNLVIWDYFERNNLKQLLVFNLFVFFVRFWFRLVYCCYWNQRLGLNC